MKENTILRDKASYLVDELDEITKNNKVDYAVVYGEFMYQAGPWPYERRVVCKVEKPENQMTYMYTFIVTNMKSSPEYLIKFYCKREILPKSLMRKAITYAINQREYLENFLKDARIQLSNNLAEQSVKPFVIGRSNRLFANTANGANVSTLIYSIIQSAILNNLIPQKYLTFVFDTIQSGGDASLLVLWSDEIPESCKNKKS